MKFKKKSNFETGALDHILESKARISINTKTGKHEFTYANTSNNKSSGQKYLQNSDSEMVN